MRRKLPDVSTTQLVASGLATLAAAIGASYIGVYGTIIGAAFMSVASTAGASICKHYLDQGKQQIKERTHFQAEADGRGAARGAAARATSADPTRTVAWPGDSATRAPGEVPHPAGNRAGGGPAAAGGAAGSGDPNATRFDLPLAGGPAGGGDPNATQLDRSPAETVAAAMAEDGAVRGAAWRDAFRNTLEWARQHWVKLAVSSAAVFAIVLGGITIYEATTGTPIGRNHDTGTSVRNVFGGGGGQDQPGDAPSDTPSTKQGTPSETPGTSTSGTPSDGPSTTPTGRPGESPSDAPTTAPTSQPTEPSVPPAPSTPVPSSGDGGQGNGEQQGTPRSGGAGNP